MQIEWLNKSSGQLIASQFLCMQIAEQSSSQLLSAVRVILQQECGT